MIITDTLSLFFTALTILAESASYVGSLETGPSGPSKTAPPSSVKKPTSSGAPIIFQDSQNDESEQDSPFIPPIVTTSAARSETAGAAPSQPRNLPLKKTSPPFKFERLSEVRAHHDFGKDDDDDDDNGTFKTLNDPAYQNHNHNA